MKYLLALFLLLISTAAQASCPPPYDSFSSTCTNKVFSVSNYYALPAIEVDLGGGSSVTRYDPAVLSAAGYGACYAFGSWDAECFAVIANQADNALKNTKFDTPTGTTSQVVLGNGTLGALPTVVSRTFNYPSRSLNSCYQISSTRDSDFHYKVDVSASLTLTAGAQGTVTATSYTNNTCTTGAQAVADGTSAQTGALIVGLGVGQLASVPLDGTLPAGKWVKLTTTNTVGTPTFAIRAVQSEVLQ